MGDKVVGGSVMSIGGVAEVGDGPIAGHGIGPTGRNGTTEECASFANH